MTRFTLITVLPELVVPFREVGIVGRAVARGLVSIDTLNPREFATDRRATVDDAPYGGGPGMVMTIGPLRRAIEAARGKDKGGSHVAYLSPQGVRLTHARVVELSHHPHLVLLAGRYEGVDERLIEADVDSEWSVGDFVVTGGELPAMLMIESIVRLLPGALGDPASAVDESFADGLLDHPHYTRPEEYEGVAVPPVLLSGDHAAIARWRRRERLRRTLERRPDLLEEAWLDDADRAWLQALRAGSDPAQR